METHFSWGPVVVKSAFLAFTPRYTEQQCHIKQWINALAIVDDFIYVGGGDGKIKN